MFDINSEIIKTLRATPPVLNQLTAHLNPAQASWRPHPDMWAIVEIVAHMADVDERALSRVHRILHEQHPVLPAFDQEALARERRYLEMDLPTQLRRYEASRRSHIELLLSLDPGDWTRTGHHEVHGDTTLTLYESHVAAEDVDHLAQISAVLAELPSDRSRTNAW
ncbi:MAG: DinB family protein [Betaproteobacteria bacterium]